MRVAEEKDIPAVVEMARQVHEGSIYSELAPFITEDAKEAFTAMLSQKNHALLVEGDPAMAVFIIRFQKMIANQECKTAFEILWFVQPEHRGMGAKFARDVEAWVKEQGVHLFALSVATGLDPRVMMLYDRMGYIPSEIHFMKVL